MIRSINQNKENYYMNIKGLTWKKKYHKLFDYDQTSLQQFISFTQNIQLKSTYFLIFRNKDTLQLKLELKKQMKKMQIEQIQQNHELICGCKAVIKDKYFQIKFYQPDQILYETESLDWLQNQHLIVVRSLKNSQKQPLGYRLQSKNIIKIGNRQFFIHQIVTNEENKLGQLRNNMLDLVNMNTQKKYQEFTKNQGHIDYLVNNNQKVYDADGENIKEDDQCKYCMLHESELEQDFLCSPCKCTGSCSLVHFNCLVKWNQKKVTKSQNKGLTEYNFQKFFCEVCQQQYPQYIRKKSIVHQLLPIEKPEGSYMILQDFYSTKRHVIIVKDISEALIIGRSNQCHLKIQSSTVSRRHAEIKKIHGIYWIFDLKSKYGTLVKQINLNVLLRQNDKFSIQAANTVITFSLQEKDKNLLMF